jgi:purine-binding chemotaxis protein CheW
MENTKDKKTEIQTVQYVVFNMANEEYGIEITDLKEIIEVPDITSIPNAPDFIKGITDLRGEIVTVIDLKKRFNLHETAVSEDAKKRILVIKINDSTFGLLVDDVKEILKVPVDSVKKTPDLVTTKIHSDYLKGVSTFNDRLILLLNVSKILDEEDLQKISKINNK